MGTFGNLCFLPVSKTSLQWLNKTALCKESILPHSVFLGPTRSPFPKGRIRPYHLSRSGDHKFQKVSPDALGKGFATMSPCRKGNGNECIECGGHDSCVIYVEHSAACCGGIQHCVCSSHQYRFITPAVSPCIGRSFESNYPSPPSYIFQNFCD